MTRESSAIKTLDWVCLLILSVLPLIVFWPETTGREVWAAGDFSEYHVPSMAVASQLWRHHILPLWNPYLTGGTPLLAAQQSAVLYPLHIVLWLTMSPWSSMVWTVLIHFSLAGVFTFLFLRSLKLNPLPSTLGALVFTFSGFSMSQLGHLGSLRALPWIPLTLFSVNRWMETRKSRYLALIACSTGLLLLTGFPQVIVYALLLTGSYLLLIRPLGKSASLWALTAFALGFGLSMIQSYPTAAMWSTREFLRPGEGMYANAMSYSFHPAYLLTMLFPLARGCCFSEMVGYIGVAPLLLAFCGMLGLGEKEETTTRRFFTFWAGIALLLAFGRFLPLLAELIFHIPTYGSFGLVSKHMMEFDFSLAVLSAYGLEDLLKKRAFRRWNSPLNLSIYLFLVFVIFLAFRTPFTGDAVPTHWNPSFQEVGKPLLFLIASVLFIILARLTPRKWSILLAAVLILLGTGDTLDFGLKIYPRPGASPKFFSTSPATADYIHQQISNLNPARMIAFEASGVLLERSLAKNLLATNYNGLYSVESLLAHEGLQLRRFNQVFEGKIPPWGLVDNQAIDDVGFRRQLDLYGTRFLLIKSSDSSVLAKYFPRVLVTDQVTVFENRRAKPRLFVVAPPPTDSSGVKRFGPALEMVNHQLIRIRQNPQAAPQQVLLTWWKCREPLQENYALSIAYHSKKGELVQTTSHPLGSQVEGDSVPSSLWSCPGNYVDEFVLPEGFLRDREPTSTVEFQITGSSSSAKFHQLMVIESNRAVSESFPEDSSSDLSPLEEAARDEFGRMWSFNPGPGRTVQLTRYEGYSVEANVEFDSAGVLVHSTNDVSGWRAWIDDRETTIFRVDGYLQGISVPAGKHFVKFQYEPVSFKVGLTISGLSGLLLIGMCLLQRRPRPKHFEQE